MSGADEADNLLDLGFAGGNSKSDSCGSSCCGCGSCSSKGSSIVEHNDSDEPNEAALIELDCSGIIKLNNSNILAIKLRK